MPIKFIRHCICCHKVIVIGELCVGCARTVTVPGIRAAIAKGRKK